MLPDKTLLTDAVRMKMPFGRFEGRIIADLPISYLEYFKRKGGFPEGRLGQIMETVYEIKINGLDELITKLKTL
ncbi:MAG: DUF3820 family protein [Flavobacteriales bacterium]|nr:DUF3820 family protein [Flavobacteriales bacterium]